MGYSTLQIGVTGPAGRIGSGTEYHIDSKFRRGTSWEEITKAFDAKANRYKQDGRNIVFSNNAVSGLVYNPEATLEQKIKLLQDADAAHSHSVHENFHSFDYFAPKGTDRWDRSAEGAPIYAVGLPGQKAEGSTGGDYGNFGTVFDTAGNIFMKVGHGDNQLPVFKGGTFGKVDVDSYVAPPKASEAKERVRAYKDMSKSELNTMYDKMRSEDPAKARVEGMKMHKAFFGKE